MAALANLSEDAIRNRVNLKHDNLEDVKSLSLPGTYHEKVTSIGNSLRKFSRLKHLDLSRNALTSLSGLEHLKLLENLNLYYNGISSLEELKCLCHNSNLVEIDLRLNPVARDEPDYRLFLIHLLPNLQKLDDRGVRDRERQAALVHFTSGEAAEFSVQPGPVIETTDRQTHPRAEYVRNVNKRVTVLDDDDVEVLDLIARTGGDLSKPRQITGSTARQDNIEEYSLDGLKSLPDGSLETRNLPSEHGQKSAPVAYEQSFKSGTEANHGLTEEQAYIYSKYPNIPSVPTGRGTSPSPPRQQGTPQLIGDPNLKYTDEVEAYTKYKGHGYFTPHPGFSDSQGFEKRSSQTRNQTQHQNVQPPGGPPPVTRNYNDDHYPDGVEVYSNQPTQNGQAFPVQKLEFDSTLQAPINGTSRQGAPPQSSEMNFPSNATPIQEDYLNKLMDLVDKYWNGSKSLHKNPKFKTMAVDLTNSLEKAQCGQDGLSFSQQQQQQQAKIRSLSQENKALREREASYKNLTTVSSLNETELKTSLKQAYEDVEALRSHLQKYVNENKRLQLKLNDTEATATSVTTSAVNQSQIDQLERENEGMKQEVDRLRIRLKQLGQVEEVASMLQESHKSLVQTNDHLLKEIEQTRSRHQHEDRQLHWSYDQLKKTMTTFNGSGTAGSFSEY